MASNRCIPSDGRRRACPGGAATDGPADNRRSTGTSHRGGENFSMLTDLAASHRSAGTSPAVPVMRPNRNTVTIVIIDSFVIDRMITSTE